MSRIQTSFYGADPETQFWYATADIDIFNRELDIYRLSLALERHTHEPGRGKPLGAGSLGTGVVVEANIGPLSVTETKIANGAVTNVKLANNAVTYSKILWPLAQPSDDSAGGFILRNVGNTRALTYYVATNGLVVFGATAIGSSASNMTLGLAGEVSVGSPSGALGAGLFSVFQRAVTVGSGVRIYSTNTSIYHDWYVDSGGYLVHGASGSIGLWMGAGRFCIGAGNYQVARINIAQATPTSAEGIYFNSAGGSSYIHMDAGNHLALTSPSTSILLFSGLKVLSPALHNDTWLGHPGIQWSNLYTVLATISGAATVGGTLGVTGHLSGSSAAFTTSVTVGTTLQVTGITTHSAAINGTSVALTGALSSGTLSVAGTSTLAAVTGTTASFTGLITTSAGNITAPAGLISAAGLSGPLATTSIVLTGNGTVEGTWNPHLHAQDTLGTTGVRWAAIYVVNGYKAGGGAWVDPSDKRTKIASSIRPYDRGLATVQAIKPVYYTQNGLYGTLKDAEFVGVVADDVEDLVPEMLTTAMIPRTPKSKTPDEIKVWDSSNLPYMLIRAVQELATRIEDIEATLTLMPERKN